MRHIPYLCIIVALFFAGCSQAPISDGYGSFEATETLISSRVNGTVETFPFDEGATVHQGDVIARIDSTDYQLSIRELQASLTLLKTKTLSTRQQKGILGQQLATLQKEYNRFSALVEESAVPQKQLDDIDAQLKLVQKQIAQAETAITMSKQEYDMTLIKLDRATLQMHRCIIRAPHDGVLLQSYTDPGELVGAGSPIAVIADLSAMKAVFYLAENQLSSLTLGTAITISADGPEGLITFPGTISFIASKAEFTPKSIQTRDERVKLVYRIEADVVNDGRIKIGMPLEVNLSSTPPQ